MLLGEFDRLAHIGCDCPNDEICALFWNLDNFNDFDTEDETDSYEELEALYEKEKFK